MKRWVLLLVLTLAAITATAGATTEFSRELSAKLGLAQNEEPTEAEEGQDPYEGAWIALGIAAATYGVVVIAKAAADDAVQPPEDGSDTWGKESREFYEELPFGCGLLAAGLLFMAIGLE